MGNVPIFLLHPLLIFLGLGCLLAFGNGRNIPSNSPGCSTLDVREGLLGRSGFINRSYRWKDLVIYMDESFTSAERTKMESALEELRGILPCVTFELTDSKPSITHYVHVTRKKGGCWSLLGRRGGKQEMNLAPVCFQGERTVMHELLHALGVHHEHNRSDRDDYITIFWENIPDGWLSQYIKVSDDYFSDFGVPYNSKSIMHYPTDYRYNRKPNMLAKDGSDIIPATTLQDTDILKLQRMYKCGNENENEVED